MVTLLYVTWKSMDYAGIITWLNDNLKSAWEVTDEDCGHR